MGAWGTGLFEKDAGMDLALEVAEGGGLTRVEEAIDAVLACGSDYLEASVAEECLAAAAIVARLKSGSDGATVFPESLERWFARAATLPPARLARKARRAIQRVLSETKEVEVTPGILGVIRRAFRQELSGPSEILEIWSDSADLKEWRQRVDALRARL